MTHVVHPSGDFSLVDEPFRADPSQRVVLYLAIDDGGLAASLYSPRKNMFLSLDTVAGLPGDDTAALLKRWLGSHELLRRARLSSSRVILTGSRHTLLPSAFFRESDKERVFRFHYPVDGDTEVCSQLIRCFNARLLFPASRAVLSACRELLPDPAFYHHTGGLAENFFLEHRHDSGPAVLLNSRSEASDILVLHGRRLLLLNSYTCKTPEDALYHVLNVYDQLQLNPENDRLYLSGGPSDEQALYRLLYTYIRHIEPAARPAAAAYSPALGEMPAHLYHALFSLVLCES